MHNIDRNMLEGNFETGAFEYEQFEGPYSHEFGHEAEQFEGPYSHEYGHEAEGSFGEAEAYETGLHGESMFGEAEEMELAAELLEISSEQEFEQFLGRLVKKAGAFLKSPAGQALGGVLKGLAKKALPLAGTALGGMIGGPIGAKIGQGLATVAGKSLGLEAEMSHEDREFEGARQFVRIAGQTAQQLAYGTRGDPRLAAQRALLRAVRINAPGLLQAQQYGGYGTPSYAQGGRQRSGRWMRRGNRIVLLGV